MVETNTKDLIDLACDNFKEVRSSGKKKFTKLGVWLKKESILFKDEINKNEKMFFRYKRGQIIKVDFGINIGTEFSNTHFAIVINDDDSVKNDNITVLPLTSKNGYKRVYLGNLMSGTKINKKYQNNETYGVITQIKTISKKRILLNDLHIICNSNILSKIDIAIRKHLCDN